MRSTFGKCFANLTVHRVLHVTNMVRLAGIYRTPSEKEPLVLGVYFSVLPVDTVVLGPRGDRNHSPF